MLRKVNNITPGEGMYQEGIAVAQATKARDTTPFAADPADAGALRSAFGRFATGVTIVTAPGPDGPVGITANSFASLSLDPPLVLWSPARGSRRFPLFAAAGHYAIHVLGVEQAGLGRHFAQQGLDFDLPGVVFDTNGVPHLPGCLARFDCAAEAQHDGGDHVILVGRVLHAEFRDGAPLVFSGGHYGSFTPG